MYLAKLFNILRKIYKLIHKYLNKLLYLVLVIEQIKNNNIDLKGKQKKNNNI